MRSAILGRPAPCGAAGTRRGARGGGNPSRNANPRGREYIGGFSTLERLRGLGESERSSNERGASSRADRRARVTAAGLAGRVADALSRDASSAASESFRWTTRSGASVAAVVTQTGGGYQVSVAYKAARTGTREKDVYMHWGAHRSSPDGMYHPQSMVPEGSQYHEATRMMRSPTRAGKPPEGAGVYIFSTTVPLDAVPIMLSCLPVEVYRGRPDSEAVVVRPDNGDNFVVPIGCTAGTPSPLGASLAPRPRAADGPGARQRVNFAFVSRHATGVNLCLVRYDPRGGDRAAGFVELALDPVVNKTGDVWHVSMDGLQNFESLYYGFRVLGDVTWEGPHRFDPQRIMLDPYATLARGLPYSALPEDAGTKRDDSTVYLGNLLGAKAAVPLVAFDWQGTARPSERRPFEEVMACEIDVRNWGGSFEAAAARVVEIKKAGFNAVVLANLSTLSGDGSGPRSRAPVSFLSPDPSLASGANPADGRLDARHPAAAASELRALVRVCHAVDIEVLATVSFGFLPESGDFSQVGPQSLRGSDNALYFRDGTILNCNHPVVANLILDSMRHLYHEYELDGFVVANAEQLAINYNGMVVDAPPLVEELSFDYRLGRMSRLVASPESTNLLPRQGARGFPHWGRWSEACRYVTDDLWTYMMAAPTPREHLGKVATRLTGSHDIFGPSWDAGLPGNLAAGRRPSFSWVRCLPHGVGSLREICEKGPREALRLRTLISLIMLAPGVPLVPLGLDGDLPDSLLDLPKLLRVLASFRARHISLLQPESFDNQMGELTWHGVMPMSEPCWEPALGARNEGYLGMKRARGSQAVYVGINPHEEPVAAALPSPPPGTSWALVASTSAAGGVVAGPGTVPVGPWGLVALEAAPANMG